MAVFKNQRADPTTGSKSEQPIAGSPKKKLAQSLSKCVGRGNAAKTGKKHCRNCATKADAEKKALRTQKKAEEEKARQNNGENPKLQPSASGTFERMNGDLPTMGHASCERTTYWRNQRSLNPDLSAFGLRQFGHVYETRFINFSRWRSSLKNRFQHSLALNTGS
jgi:hypothetical protein